MKHAAIGAVLSALVCHAGAEVTLIGKASIPGTARDRSQVQTEPGSSVAPDLLGSFGSAIAYTGAGHRFVAVDDRGPNNGLVAWRCRFQTFDVNIDPGSAQPVTVNLFGTTLLSNAAGEPFTGNTGAYDLHDQSKGLRLDPEGIRVGARGTLFISDEYGPWIDEFSMDGRQLHRFVPPAKFLIDTPDGDQANEAPPRCMKGRQPNHGFEGLAISPDGSKLFALLQRPLIQDGAMDSEGKHIGRSCRLLELNIATGATREFVYTMESPSHGTNELLAINDHEFLVIERDSKGGTQTKFRKLFKIDIDGCRDVSGVERLPSGPMGEGAAKKSVFLDFLDPKCGVAGESMPEKIEGLAWGPDLSDGRHVLVVTTDNDLRPDQPSWFWVYAVGASDISLRPQNMSEAAAR